tara:strand:- start:240 stop:842 length:603 start_codon:yes stop_codon:yes gene_type:complete
MKGIIHQIFFKFTDKNLEDWDCYVEGSKKWQKFCKDNDWEYQLHTEVDESIMTEEEIRIMNLASDRYFFCKQNFYRLIVLNKFGGMYVDLDVSPTDNFEKIKDNEIIIGCSVNPDSPQGTYYVNDNVMKFPPELSAKLLKYSMEQVDEKLKIGVYKTWLRRFYLHTVSAKMVYRFCQKHKISVDDNWHDYFIDYNTQTWD